ncbi:styrene monooxygenase/indole monooxygenase family protein [Kitasatospora sp. NPDC054939]
MRRILIVGAGQAGLQLALGLQSHGYEVTVATDRSADEVRGGRVLSTQCMFEPALRTERALGLDLWAGRAPAIECIDLAVAAPQGPPAVRWSGRLDAPARSVDQRVKLAAWLDTFAERGGTVELGAVTVADLDRRAARHDLVLVAAGKGELSALFERDADRSPYAAPQRTLAVAYVHGLAPRPGAAAVGCNLVPGAGEFFTIPALTTSGPCDIVLWETVPGGPLDVFDGVRDPAELLRRTLRLAREHVPWEYERAAGGVELTDAGATLAGRFAPTVRRPIGELPGGGTVLGLADTVVLNDPVTGQGANNAARAADLHLAAILEHGDKPFDRDFMQGVFDRYWAQVRVATTWTNAMLAPAPPHVLELIGAAERLPAVARRFANAFADPADLEEWFLDPAGSAAYLASAG